MSENSLLLEFLRFLLTATGTGFAVYKTMEELKRLWPRDWKPLSGDQKFYSAWLLSFIYPLAAYLFMAAVINGAPITWEGIFASFSVGYMASQKLFRDREEEAEAKGV